MRQQGQIQIIQKGQQVLAMSTNHRGLPVHVAELDASSATVQNQTKLLHDWSAHQHGCFSLQEVHLDIAKLASQKHGQLHRPLALRARIAPKMEGARASHELQLRDVKVHLTQLLHIALEGAKTTQKR